MDTQVPQEPHQAQTYNPYSAPGVQHSAGPRVEASNVSYPLASLGQRFIGSFFDGVLMIGAMIPGALLSLLVPASLLDEPILGAGEVAIIFGLFTSFVFACYQWYLVATTGQTIAKSSLKMKIVTLDDGEVGFVQGVLLRSWVMGLIGAVPFVGGLASFADPLFIFGEHRRCLHDHIASTKVIQLPS